jgi:hypothetical protein
MLQSPVVGLVKALEEKFGFPILVPPEPLITGALGAALVGKEVYQKYAAEGQMPTRSGRGLEEARIFT